jgi:hypothetical protein
MMSFESLERARPERIAKNANKTEKEARKTAKEVKNVASARTRGRGSCRRPKNMRSAKKNVRLEAEERCLKVDALEPTTKVSQTSEAQVAEVEQGVGSSEPRAKVAQTSKAQAEEDKRMQEP